MLISCEKCSTTYVLDEALIPPQGTPVQCTRCGHVFTARAAAPEPTPAPPARAPAGNSTMMFGAPAVPAAPARNQTMMFGGPSGSAAPAPAAPPPAAAKNQTMMFGTPASNAAAAAPHATNPPANSSAKATMVFGASPVAAPPAPNKNQTMMFGTPASNAAPPPAAAPSSAKATMVFGAVPPVQAPTANKNQTMMFGTPASNAAPPVAPPAAPVPPNKNQTMMFGTPASNAAPAAPAAPTSARTTMMFGGVQAPPPAQPSSKQTMVFGAVPPAAAQPSFGTPASQIDPESPVDETIIDQPGQSARTLMFGVPTAENPNVSAPANKNQTMMFGKSPVIPKISAGTVELSGMAVDESAPNESTVRVDLDQHQHDMASEEPQEPQRQDRTQRFAMSDVEAPAAETAKAVQERHNRTQLFAMTQETTVPVAQPLPRERPADMTIPHNAHNAPTIDLTTTLPPDLALPPMEAEPAGVSVLHDPASAAPQMDEAQSDAGVIATTLPNLGPVSPGRSLPPLNVELPPEPGGSPADFARPAPQVPLQDDAAAMRAARGGGAGRVVVVVLALVALVLLGVLVYRLFGDQITGKLAPEPEPHPVGMVIPAAPTRLS